ncbi:MAG: CusA/CzcA family heavy metal efflux RND transporter [Bacteroidota bacterium]|jgi:heavy metal efflux system protein
MNRFIKDILGFSLKNKFFILFATLVIVVIGIISYRDIPIEAFPDVTNTRVIIIAQWPGRSAEEIEKFVTVPLEIAMNSVQGKTDVRSITLFGLSVVTIMFEDEVKDAFARQQVNNLLGNVTLPEGVEAGVEPPYGPTGEIYRYTLYSRYRSVKELKTIQDWVLERQFKSVAGIADVVSFGGEVKAYEISIDPLLLEQYDISPLDVYQAVNKNNINVGGDIIEKNNQAYVVRGIGLITGMKDMENIIVKYIQDVPILVKNVATVRETCLPRLGQVGRDLNNDAVEGIIVMRKGENPSKVIKGVKAKIAQLNEKILPSDVKIVPFYDREDLIHFTTGTVLHNLIEGIVLVTVIVFLFMADWRTTVIVSVIIPLALLFAFIGLHLMGMSANLLSMGAIDFGIIIDGAVVMVEGLFVVFDRKAKTIGMPAFNLLAKSGIIREAGTDMARAIFFSKLIIILCLMPIFSFQKVEGKMFSPLAWTLGFALLGALIFTLTLVPVLIRLMLNKNVKEKHNPVVVFIEKTVMAVFNLSYRYKRISLGIALFLVITGFASFKFLGTEFLPQLNEGSIYVRANLPLSISLEAAVKLSGEMRAVFRSFPEVKQVLSQTGRPNDGTDPTGFYNAEFHVDLYPKSQWKRNISKEELISGMQQKLSVFPGINFNFSQPIMDNVEEAVSGVKGSIAVKIFGNDLNVLEDNADTVYKVLSKINGIEDLGVIRNIGQPELRIELDDRKMAQYGAATADCQAVIEMAIGGKAATQFYEGDRRFDIRIRYKDRFRQNDQQIGNLKVPAMNGKLIALKELGSIRYVTGPLLIFREENQRFIAIKFSVRGRDMGSTVKEARDKVDLVLKLPKGSDIKWAGDFENQQRAQARLAQVVPISLLLIFLVLFMLFGNVIDAGLVLTNVPFAIIGGIAALQVTGVNFSISAGIGFIALFGICIQNGVLLTMVIKKNLRARMPYETAIKSGVESRIRPIVMTALMAMFGLLPAAVSTGIGSETQKPLAIVVIGGLISATALTLIVFPLIIHLVYRRSLKDKLERGGENMPEAVTFTG